MERLLTSTGSDEVEPISWDSAGQSTARRAMIGRIIRANMRSFVFGTRVPESDVPIFGALVKTRLTHREATIFGLIYDIAVNEDDDGMTRMLSVAEDVREEDIAWQRSRLIPLNVHVLCVGYREANGLIRHQFPPQPPVALNEIECCTTEEIARFTERLDHFQLVLESRDAPCDELLAASISQAAAARPAGQRRSFVIECGRELARLLMGDTLRLERIFRRIQWNESSG
ncbi:MAG: hypothetical protein RMN25_11235 [Anaerolineae bacterium]|nr:hypothetical protein [Thermoflexales bacterium]MDW8408342.1 hypothetical protein [Anaerolineae bacterium]